MKIVIRDPKRPVFGSAAGRLFRFGPFPFPRPPEDGLARALLSLLP